jgi:MFS family permease
MLHLYHKREMNIGGTPLGKSFWRYFGAQAVSNLGSFIGRLALAFLVYDLTSSTAAMGALVLVQTIPENLLRLLGAPLIDRFPRLKLMAALDLFRCLIYIIPWLFFQTGHPTIWVLYLIAFVGGLSNALYSPAAMAIVPALVPTGQLQRANGLVASFFQTLAIVGPMVGVAVCGFLGNANALLLDGLSFGICGLALALTIKHPAQTTAARRAGWAGYRAELVEGFAVFKQIPALLTITIVLAISNLGSSGSTTMLLPLVREHLGASNALLGTIETGFAVGALAAALVASSFVLRTRRAYVMLAGLAMIQLAQLIAAFLPPPLAIAMVGAWGLYGFGMNTYSVHSQTIYQQLVPDHLRGRVMSVRMLTAWGLNPIGQFLGTVIATKWGPTTTFLVGGGIPLLITLSAFFFPSLRALDQVENRAKVKDEDSLPAKQGAPTAIANSSQ